MSNYTKGKIYGIYFNDELKYIGSTIQELNKRLKGHFTEAKKQEYKTNFHKFIYENLNEISSFNIKLLEDYSCEGKAELQKKETEYQLIHRDNILNMRLADKSLMTIEEKKAQTKKWNKDFRERHLEEVRAYERERTLVYAKNNRALRNEIQYRSNLKNRVEHTCECGKKLADKKHLWQHVKSQKHIKFLETL